ncbi:ankyrin repeat domain-containing [Trichoderma arundinaceum]|uniref:Ankyrin repeat domain-containing n=1 Tax=Trichoderma arundinaceum TaxID=490622 RepID=A0A395NLF8_TRIAR|nr:ankyrin repeat domain-containing [Trichoderma arundinaceum]
MNGHARQRTGATSKRARSANIKGSVFGDNARIHQGDQNIYFKYSRYRASSPSGETSSAVQAQLEAKEKDDCRRSLGFRDMDARVENISPTQPGTCEWFFETSHFQQWYGHSELDNGLLWIKGNPGTGKSTLMKRILKHCQTKEDYIIAAYFFNARGTELEKTPLGMLRSLLFQLLKHEPSLYDPLLPIFRKKQEEHGSGGWEWREPELKSFLLSEISQCRARPPLLIIDALDECSDPDVQNVAEFLQHLSTIARDAGITLNICLSSRHYPFFRFKGYQELVLEKEKDHNKDIVVYVRSNLIIKDKAIEEAIKKKARGIFMWVVLVITILNRAYDDGKVDAMTQKLNEIPADLGEVFETLLNRNNPDKDETILILQCVLFAKQLLTPEEIYFALIAGTNGQKLGKWDPSQITPDIIRRRIISSSRGLVEIRKGERETVQFIHGSVNDFLVRNSRLQTLDPGLASDPVAKSHGRLQDCCMSYMMMESLELPKNRRDIENLASSYPFLEYSSRHLFDHAEEATSAGQREFLQTLKGGSVFQRVERLHDCFEDYGQCGRRLNLLHILAARGLHKLIVILLEGDTDINAQGRPHGTALEAAIEHQHEKTIKVLLNKGAKIDARGRFTHSSALKKAIDTQSEEILTIFIERGAKLNIWERILNSSLLHAAISNGNRDAIAMLLDKGAKINARGFKGTALRAAVATMETEIVEMLLEKGAKVNARGLMGTALHEAAHNGDKEIVEMLLERGAKVDARGLMGTALQKAVASREKEIVEMLLEKGANVNVRGVMGTSLQTAAYNGDPEIIEILLDKGAKIDTQGFKGTALQVAAAEGVEEVVELLLAKGAKVNARGLFGTALQMAAHRGREEIVEMLLEKGAKVNARGGFYGTAIHAAAFHGSKKVIKMLLDKGADVNARGGFTGTVLQGAAFQGDKELVKMLLDNGVDVNAWGGLFGTALQAASNAGSKEIVEMLLDHGAKIDAGRWGFVGSALQAAAIDGNKEVIEVLLDKGAKINTWGRFYSTALQAAAFKGHVEIVEMLLDRGARGDGGDAASEGG